MNKKNEAIDIAKVTDLELAGYVTIARDRFESAKATLETVIREINERKAALEKPKK